MTSLAPAPSTPVPAGTFSAPRESVLTIVAPGSQIYDGRYEAWLTVTEFTDCLIAGHNSMCRVVHFDLRVTAHLPLSAERWIRHPVSTS